jgi:hypothetical protein
MRAVSITVPAVLAALMVSFGPASGEQPLSTGPAATKVVRTLAVKKASNPDYYKCMDTCSYIYNREADFCRTAYETNPNIEACLMSARDGYSACASSCGSPPIDG